MNLKCYNEKCAFCDNRGANCKYESSEDFPLIIDLEGCRIYKEYNDKFLFFFMKRYYRLSMNVGLLGWEKDKIKDDIAHDVLVDQLYYIAKSIYRKNFGVHFKYPPIESYENYIKKVLRESLRLNYGKLIKNTVDIESYLDTGLQEIELAV